MKRKYLWPITLVVCGLLMVFFGIASNVGWITVPLYKVVIAIPFVAHIVVKGIIRKRFYTIPIPLAVLFLLFEKQIANAAGVDGGNLISNWIVIIAALCIFIGLALITLFSSNDRKKENGNIAVAKDHTGEDENVDVSINTTGPSKVSINTAGASAKYINCHGFVHDTVECGMGACKIFFTNTSEYNGGGTLNLRADIGSIVVCVPAEWDVDVNIDNHMGSVKVDDNTPIEGAKKLRIVGENNMGAIHVKFN